GVFERSTRASSGRVDWTRTESRVMGSCSSVAKVADTGKLAMATATARRDARGIAIGKIDIDRTPKAGCARSARLHAIGELGFQSRIGGPREPSAGTGAGSGGETAARTDQGASGAGRRSSRGTAYATSRDASGP